MCSVASLGVGQRVGQRVGHVVGVVGDVVGHVVGDVASAVSGAWGRALACGMVVMETQMIPCWEIWTLFRNCHPILDRPTRAASDAS